MLYPVRHDFYLGKRNTTFILNGFYIFSLFHPGDTWYNSTINIYCLISKCLSSIMNYLGLTTADLTEKVVWELCFKYTFGQNF